MEAIVFFVNSTKIYQFKATDSKKKIYLLCLGNNSKDFPANNMKKQDFMDMYTIFWLMITLLIPVISSILIHIWWRNMI